MNMIEVWFKRAALVFRLLLLLSCGFTTNKNIVVNATFMNVFSLQEPSVDPCYDELGKSLMAHQMLLLQFVPILL